VGGWHGVCNTLYVNINLNRRQKMIYEFHNIEVEIFWWGLAEELGIDFIKELEREYGV